MKKIFLIFLLILAGILIFIFLFLAGKKEKKEEIFPIKNEEIFPTKISLEECEKIPFEKDIKRTLCFIKLGEKEKNIEICKKIEDLRDRSYCFGGAAGAKNDLKICQTFGEEIEKDFIFLEKGALPPYIISNFFARGVPVGLDLGHSFFRFNSPITSSGDALAWDLAYAIFQPCFIGASLVSGNENFCQPQKNTQFWGDEEYCKNKTIILKAFAQKDPTLCEGISIKDTSTKEEWLAFCYGVVALRTNEAKLCEKIPEDDEKSICVSLIASTYGDPEICEKMLKKTLWKDYCIFEVAYTTSNIEICKKIDYPSIQIDCLLGVAGKLFTQGKFYYDKFCEKVDKTIQNRCKTFFEWQFYYLKNTSPCETIEDKEFQAKCYSFVAANTKNEEICNLIKNPEIKDECFFKTAKVKKDKTLCQKIKNPDKKSRCFSDLSDLYMDF